MFIQFIPFFAILAVVAAAIWWSRRTIRIADEKDIDLHLEGFRGWLLVLVLWQVLSLLAALWNCWEIVRSLDAAIDQDHLTIAAPKIAIAFTGLLLWGATFYLMFGRRRAFVRLFVISALYQVIGGLGLDALAAAAQEIAPWEIGSVNAGHSIVGSSLSAAIWIGYVRASRRVKNTFVR